MKKNERVYIEALCLSMKTSVEILVFSLLMGESPRYEEMNPRGRLIWRHFEKRRELECREEDSDWEREDDWDEELYFEAILNWVDMHPEDKHYLYGG